MMTGYQVTRSGKRFSVRCAAGVWFNMNRAAAVRVLVSVCGVDRDVAVRVTA